MSLRCLIIEDDPHTAEMLFRYLKPIATELHVSADLPDAVLALSGKVFEIVTLDLTLPSSVGPMQTLREFAPKIKEYAPNSLLIVISGTVDPSVEPEARKAGVDIFMVKAPWRGPRGFLTTLGDAIARLFTDPKPVYEPNVDLLEKIVDRIATATAPQSS